MSSCKKRNRKGKPYAEMFGDANVSPRDDKSALHPSTRRYDNAKASKIRPSARPKSAKRCAGSKEGDACSTPGPKEALDFLFLALRRQLTQRIAALALQSVELTPPARFAWQTQLRELWMHHGKALSSPSLAELLAMSYAGDDWPMVIAAGEALRERDELDATGHQALVRGYWTMGRSAEALTLARKAVLSWPQSDELFAQMREVMTWDGRSAAWSPHNCGSRDEGDIRLETLGQHHMRDFAWQYEDPAIAELCCLPRFDGAQGWLAWLEENNGYPDQLLCAVLHRHWGFIGSVCLILLDGLGYFYFWIGRAFRGAGHGSAAVRLLLRSAREHWSMQACYTKAFEYNGPSRRALAKLGFAELDIAAAPPHGEERFFRLGNPAPRTQIAQDLHVLHKHMDSAVRPAMPWLLQAIPVARQWHEARHAN